MKRKQFFKTVAIGSAATLVGYPLFQVQAANGIGGIKYADLNHISWKNTEHLSPYVDSNLWIRHDGIDILNATQTGNGVIDLSNGSSIDIIQMGIGNSNWPTGYSGYLYIFWNQYGGRTPDGDPYMSGTLYDNEVTSWKQGPIDSFTIDLSTYLLMDGCAEFKISCYTGPSGL